MLWALGIVGVAVLVAIGTGLVGAAAVFLKRWAEKWCKRQDEQKTKFEAYKRLKQASDLDTRLRAEAKAEEAACLGARYEDLLLDKRIRARALTGLDVGPMSEKLDPEPDKLSEGGW